MHCHQCNPWNIYRRQPRQWAEIDDGTAETTARTIAEDRRIVCDLCDVGSDNSEDDSRKTAGFYVPNMSCLHTWCLRTDVYMKCQQILPA